MLPMLATRNFDSKNRWHGSNVDKGSLRTCYLPVLQLLCCIVLKRLLQVILEAFLLPQPLPLRPLLPLHPLL